MAFHLSVSEGKNVNELQLKNKYTNEPFVCLSLLFGSESVFFPEGLSP